MLFPHAQPAIMSVKNMQLDKLIPLGVCHSILATQQSVVEQCGILYAADGGWVHIHAWAMIVVRAHAWRIKGSCPAVELTSFVVAEHPKFVVS